MTGLPDLLTVEEAARVLRIGRTKAYAMAAEWRRTHGKSGLPVVDFGDALRVPRCQLETIVGGPITSLGPPEITTAVAPATEVPPAASGTASGVTTATEPEPVLDQPVSTASAHPANSARDRSPRRPSRRRTRMANQPTLPFLG
jgi:hypothetical protein